MSIERLSIELTNKCSKRCSFCYNSSQPNGLTSWTPQEVIDFVTDCARAGTQAISFGGGEPLEYPGLFDILHQLRGKVFRSITSNGLLLHGQSLDRLIAAKPDKIHLSIHFPDQFTEVNRVIYQVKQLGSLGCHVGVNLLVRRSNLAAAAQTAQLLHQAGIHNERIVYLPMRGSDTPSPRQISWVAGDRPFQSMSCLTVCQNSSRFCSISWDKQVAWCSYTVTRCPLPELTANALQTILQDLALTFCGTEAKIM